MPYKDEVKQREYQRKWYQRKKQGIPTRTTPELTNESIKENRRLWRKRYRKRKAEKRRSQIDEAFGTVCAVCVNSTNRGNGKNVLIVHRKDGVRHKDFFAMSKKPFKESLESEDYVRLCYYCHQGVHWTMLHLGMKWEDILSFLSEK